MLAQQVADLRDRLVADVHAEVFVDDVHAIDVHVQHAFGHRAAARGELRAHLGLERRAREERGERVVVGLQHRRRLARQEFGEALVRASKFGSPSARNIARKPATRPEAWRTGVQRIL